MGGPPPFESLRQRWHMVVVVHVVCRVARVVVSNSSFSVDSMDLFVLTIL